MQDPKSVNTVRPLVSVVITVYNGERFVQDAIKSVLNQSFSDLELIVVNDGSTDRTDELVSTYNDQRMNYIRLERSGRGKALNHGVRASSGNYVAILDADDVAFSDRIERQVNYLREQPEIGLVGSRYRILIDDTGQVYGGEDEEHQTSEELKSALRRGINPIFHSAVMYRRSIYDAVGGYDESLSCLLDLDLYVRSSRITSLANLDRPVSYKRKHEEQYFWGPNRKTVTADVLRARATVLLRTIRILNAPKRKYWDVLRMRVRSYLV
jgi:glycosyltransferase involved in cell wall biosynthesis